MLLSFKFYTELKVLFITPLQYYRIFYLSIFLSLPTSCIFYMLFCFNLQTPFSFSDKAGLVGMNFHSFCLSKKVFVFHSERQFFQIQYYWLAGFFFSFSTLNVLFHSLLVCTVSPRNTSVILWELPCM